MRLETNLIDIVRIAHQKKDEHIAFRAFLEEQNSSKIDSIVHLLNLELAPQISCIECGKCCQNVRPIADDVELLKYIEPENIAALKYSMGFECKHLQDKKCSIYTERYEECKAYPYLDRDGFVSSIIGALRNYEICPIVFNVIEHLKLKLDWHYKA